MCSNLHLGASSLDTAMGGRYGMEKTGVERYVVEENRGPAGAVLCEMKDLGLAVPSWRVLRMGDGRSAV